MFKNLKIQGRGKIQMGIALSILLAIGMGFSSARASTEPCRISDTGDSDLLKCYQDEYQGKFRSNESRYKSLVAHAKTYLHESASAEKNRHAGAYVELIRKINQTMISSRKTATQTCVRIAGKFQSQSTSIVAAVNCRTAYEIKLEKDLQQFEFQLQTLANQT